jgi:hypothetical protein
LDDIYTQVKKLDKKINSITDTLSNRYTQSRKVDNLVKKQFELMQQKKDIFEKLGIKYKTV